MPDFHQNMRETSFKNRASLPVKIFFFIETKWVVMPCMEALRLSYLTHQLDQTCKVCPSPPSSAVERHFAFISEEFWKLYSNYLSAARARRWSDACNWDLFLDLCWSVLEVSCTFPFKFWISDSTFPLTVNFLPEMCTPVPICRCAGMKTAPLLNA